MEEEYIKYHSQELMNRYEELLRITDFHSPIFIPRKHTKIKYADHKRIKNKRKNKK